MLARNAGILAKKSLPSRVTVGTGYMTIFRNKSQEHSSNSFRQMPERGPVTGPGVPDKTDGKEAVQLDDEWMKTRIHLDSQKPVHYTQITIDTIMHNGFIISGKQLMGKSVAVLPDTVLWWNVTQATEITADSLALFYTCYPPIELIIIGTGRHAQFIDPREIKKLHERGLRVEAMGTEKAAGTFNLLRNDRRVGLAMIPTDIDEVDEAKWKQPHMRSKLAKDSVGHLYDHKDNWNLSDKSRERLSKLPTVLRPPNMVPRNPQKSLEGRKFGDKRVWQEKSNNSGIVGPKGDE